MLKHIIRRRILLVVRGEVLGIRKEKVKVSVDVVTEIYCQITVFQILVMCCLVVHSSAKLYKSLVLLL